MTPGSKLVADHAEHRAESPRVTPTLESLQHPLGFALAWLLRRGPNVLVIPGTSSVVHLRENLAAAKLSLPDDALRELDGITAFTLDSVPKVAASKKQSIALYGIADS